MCYAAISQHFTLVLNYNATKWIFNNLSILRTRNIVLPRKQVRFVFVVDLPLQEGFLFKMQK